MSRPSSNQVEALVDFLEKNPGIAKGHLRTNQAKLETKRKWDSLAVSLNCLGGANKDGKGWAKYWAEKKCALKKICALNSASLRRTGGGQGDNIPLSAVEQRLIAVMGGQEFATGDSQYAVDPFPNIDSEVIVTQDIITAEVLSSQGPVSPLQAPLSTLQVPPVTQEPSTSQATETPAMPRPRRVNPSRARISSVDRDLERMAQMEAKRVEAEAVTAQALANAVQGLDRCASAIQDVAVAIKEGACLVSDALLEIASNMQPRNS